MIDDPVERAAIARSLGDEIDQLVRERLSGFVEEPDITSRVGQRLEDQFNEKRLGQYTIRVLTETIPSKGPHSLEKPTGTDLYVAMSVQPHNGPVITKGLLVQAKRQDKLDGAWSDLIEQCRRMCKITKKGSVVWIYGRGGVETMRASDMPYPNIPVVSLAQMFDRVLACEVGDRRRVPHGAFGDRVALIKMLRELGSKNAVWLELEQGSAAIRR